MDAKDVSIIFNEQTIAPLVQMFSQYGPFFLFVVLLIAAILLFRLPSGKWFGGVFVLAALLCGGLGIYFWVYPPARFYVHQMAVTYDMQSDPAKGPKVLALYSNESRIWINHTEPSIRVSTGQDHYEWSVLALDQVDLMTTPVFSLKIGLRDDSGSTPYFEYYDVNPKYVGGAWSTCKLTTRAGQANGGDAGQIFDLLCQKSQGHAYLNNMSLIGRAYAQGNVASPDYKDMSKEELIRLLEKMGRDNASASTNNAPVRVESPAIQVPVQNPQQVLVYYTNATDDAKIDKVLTISGLTLVKKPSTEKGPANALWFGRDVDVGVAKAVAHRLIDSGVGLTYFGRYSDPGIKTNLMEFGASAPVSATNILATADIDSYKSPEEWVVVVGSYADQKNAEARAAEIRQRWGDKYSPIAMRSSKNPNIWGVYVAHSSTKADAIAIQQSAISDGIAPDAFVAWRAPDTAAQ